MKKYIFFNSLIFFLGLLNLGFINNLNKPKVKGLVCGSKEFLSIVKKNYILKANPTFDNKVLVKQLWTEYPLEEIESKYKNDKKIYGWNYIIDINSGDLYKLQDQMDYFKIIPRNTRENDGHGWETFTIGEKINNKLYIKTYVYKEHSDSVDGKYEEEINLKNLSIIYDYEGRKEKDKCIYYSIPEDRIIFH